MSDIKYAVPQSLLDNIFKHIIEGLITDGAHHKQWYLERIMIELCSPEWCESARKEFDWDEGIAP